MLCNDEQVQDLKLVSPLTPGYRFGWTEKVTFTSRQKDKTLVTGGCIEITQQLLITISSHSFRFELRRRSIVYAASRDEDPLPGLK